MTQDALKNNPHITRQELEELHADLVGWAFSLLGEDGDEAQDMVQQCYLLLLDGKARFNGDSSLKTWLFGVIRNLSRKHRRWRRLWSTDGATKQDLAVFTQDSEKDQLKLNVRHSIGKLSRRQREVLELHTYQEFTLAECADILSLSIGSVRTHFHRAKATLRKELGVFDE